MLVDNSVLFWIGFPFGILAIFSIMFLENILGDIVEKGLGHRAWHVLVLIWDAIWGAYPLLQGLGVAPAPIFDNTFGAATGFFVGVSFLPTIFFSVMFIWDVIRWIECEWRRRKKRKALKRLGAKGRAALARLVASMPTAQQPRPAFNAFQAKG